MEDLVSLCKRRGFIFQSSEIYGGLQGVYDYGPLGVELKNNIKNAWWSSMIYENDNIEGLDSSILTNPSVLKFSGHESTFTDPMVDCRECKSRWRADTLDSDKCPGCGSTDLTDPRPFNLMFKTSIGPVDDGSSFAYFSENSFGCESFGNVQLEPTGEYASANSPNASPIKIDRRGSFVFAGDPKSDNKVFTQSFLHIVISFEQSSSL